MTDNDNKENKPKQLLLTNSGEDSDTSQNSQKPNQDNEAGLSKLPKLSLNIRYQQTAQEKELFKRLSIILTLLAISIFITLYFISPFSKVGKIIVSGVTDSDPNKIVESSNLKVGKSLWEQYFDKKESSEQVVKNNPRVKSTKINLKGLNTLQIKVTEFSTIGYVEKEGKRFEVLSNGKLLFEESKEAIKGLPLLMNFEEGENLKEFIKAYEQMDDNTKQKIDNIESLATKTNPFRIKFKMKDGNEVIGLSTTIADKMAFYDKIIAEMSYKGVIDMEAGPSGVFSYPFKTEESSETEGTSQPE